MQIRRIARKGKVISFCKLGFLNPNYIINAELCEYISRIYL